MGGSRAGARGLRPGGDWFSLAELDRIQAAADARAAALEEARADLRARAERAERELNQARGDNGGEATQAARRQPRRRRSQASEEK